MFGKKEAPNKGKQQDLLRHPTKAGEILPLIEEILPPNRESFYQIPSEAACSKAE
jgi:hypothetical protein